MENRLSPFNNGPKCAELIPEFLREVSSLIHSTDTKGQGAGGVSTYILILRLFRPPGGLLNASWGWVGGEIW